MGSKNMARRMSDEQLAEKYTPGERHDPADRGISIPQLKNVAIQAQRRCVKERWRDFNGKLIKPSKVNLYHIPK